MYTGIYIYIYAHVMKHHYTFSVGGVALVSSQNLVTNNIYSDTHQITHNVVHSPVLVITYMHLTIIINSGSKLLCLMQCYAILNGIS